MPNSAVVTVEKGAKVTNAQLIEAVKKAGYTATVKPDKDQKKKPAATS